MRPDADTLAAAGRPPVDDARGTALAAAGSEAASAQPQLGARSRPRSRARATASPDARELASLNAEIKFRRFFRSLKAGSATISRACLPAIPTAGAGPSEGGVATDAASWRRSTTHRPSSGPNLAMELALRRDRCLQVGEWSLGSVRA